MLKFLLAAFVVLLASCSDSEGVSSSSNSRFLPGMVRFSAKKDTVFLGTDYPLAKATERPQMKAFLDYTFYLGEHEVTCGEFNTLMKSSFKLNLACSSENIPATDLTYYDAVLFANERSKAEKRDTVYTYSKVLLDDEKHCTNLEGLVFHTETDGYRLPTEAEWMLVAKTVWTTAEGWTAENSDFKLHKVCSKADSSDDFCDIIGNAMEWVNDWYGNFRDTSLTNYVGAPDGGSLGQRIVKGGSYRNTAESIKIYNRGDVYTVTSSTRAEYVGFRLAFGAIPEATWMGNDGRASASRIVPVVSLSELHSITGSRRIKLAFRNATKNIAFIDYSNSILSVTEIVDSLDAYHPEISPDGKHVAFCTGLEGISGKSALYVRDLNAAGTNLVKLDVESAAIPRWRVLKNGDTVIVYVTDAGNNKDESAFKGTSTWQVKFSKGKFEKPQKLFDGAYHGGVSDDNALAVTGARVLRARVSGRDTVWYKDGEKAEQACNVSLAKDGSKRTLFLDFGGKTGRDFVGKKYGTHERLLIANASGKLIQSVGAPDGYSFDHSEWVSGVKDLAVATLANANGAHQKIVLVNTVDSSVVELVEGDELWHPSLWVNSSFDVENIQLDMDSAGVYINPGDEWGSLLMRFNMELLWRYRDSANVAIIGSSRPLYSISPNFMSPEFFAVNFAHTPNSIYASRDYLEKYLLRHLKNLKYVVVSLDIDFWHKIDGRGSDNFFVDTYKKYPGYVYDKNHEYWNDGYPKGLAECTENAISIADSSIYLDDRGRFLGTVCSSWDNPPKVEHDSTYFDDRMYLIENSLEALKSIIEMSLNRNIYVVGMIFPQNPRFKETGAFGRYGMRRSLADSLIKQFKEYEKVYSNFILFDENKMGNHDYSDDEAVDSDHLCYNGSHKITTRLDSVLRTLK